MAAVGKDAERAELHKTIWRIANDLRGSVDGWDFKAYVLGTLFYPWGALIRSSCKSTRFARA